MPLGSAWANPATAKTVKSWSAGAPSSDGSTFCERNLEAARENLSVSRDRYTEGLIPPSELLDAESRLLQSGLDRTTSATHLQQARANLDRAVGRY